MPWVDIEEYSQAVKGVSQGGQGALAVMNGGGPNTVMLQEMGRMAWALIQYKDVVLLINSFIRSGSPILVRWHLYIETGPWILCTNNKRMQQYNP